MTTRIHSWLLVAFMSIRACGAAEVRTSEFEAALIEVESTGKDNAIGDKNLDKHAYGPLQVRQPVCDDVNRRFGTTYRAEQCLGNRSLSIEIFRRYMSMYATERRLGHPPTAEDTARIWNGGPNGYRIQATVVYWTKVKACLRPAELPVPRALEVTHHTTHNPSSNPKKSRVMIAEIK